LRDRCRRAEWSTAKGDNYARLCSRRSKRSFLTGDLPRPTVSEFDVLIRIQASGVNPLDTKIRAGEAAHAKQPLPAVLGLDMASIVEEVGSRVTRFKPGDEVYDMVGGVGGHQGTLAELVAADANLIAHKSDSCRCVRLPLFLWLRLLHRKVWSTKQRRMPLRVLWFMLEPAEWKTLRFSSIVLLEQKSSPLFLQTRAPS
jgi:hypothetical protein